MKTLAKISDFAGKYMAIIALAVAIIALVFPDPVSAVVKTSYVNILLGIVMFGMGMTLKLADFKVVFTKPKAVIVGILAQFVIMPVLAFLLTMVFQLPPELAVGVILVGSCPGGTSSNVMTYLAKGDVALSVGMTACTTIMAPIVTPLLVLLFAGQTVDVNVVDMFLSIVQVVLVPIALGFLINYFFEKAARAASAVLPCSACGTTSPAQCTRTFSPARPAKTPSRRTRSNRLPRSGRTLPREGPHEAHERSLPA